MEVQEDQKGICKLGIAVSRRLKQELSDWGKFRYSKGIVFLMMSANHIESELGQLLQQIHQVIDTNFPDRRNDIPLMIVDEHHKYCLKLKIWHPAVSTLPPLN